MFSIDIPCREIFSSLDNIKIEFIVKKGRFPEEKNIEIYLSFRDIWKRLLVIKIFYGRPPYYRRWIELFLINKEINFNGNDFIFINSIYEEKLIECLSMFLKGGESLFIDYMYDDETRKALELGVLPPLTRLGYILLQKGFTWFKDWYYPEGFMEGNPKLQAEKPIDEDSKRKHIDEFCKEVRENICRVKNLMNLDKYNHILGNILKRIEYILKTMCRTI